MPSLTIFYPPLTRFDLENSLVPFSGTPGNMFKHRTLDLIPDLTYDIRLPESRGFLATPRTDFCLVLGADACGKVLGDRNINKHRGFRKSYGNVPTIVTYSHMDCWDFRDDDDESGAGDNDKDVSVTRRSNYLFWALADFRKLFKPIRPHSARQTIFKPDLQLVNSLLDRAPSDLFVSLDIETRPQDNTLDCIGLGFFVKSTWYLYIIPIYGPDHLLVYSQRDLAGFWRALTSALLSGRIIWIGHNLAFDLSILHHYYRLPFPRRIHDTMLCMHRDNPFTDKSLAHAISLYTDSTDNHKGDFCPNISQVHFTKLLKYNSDDVYWTGEVALRQLENVSRRADYQQVNDSQYVCLVMSFTGIEINTTQLESEKSRLTLKAAQLERVIRILTGRPNFNPNSGQQIAQYFYDTLTYEPPSLTDSGAPATDEKSLLKLQLKQSNPIIPLILAFKETSKELSMLNFKPYEPFKNTLVGSAH